MPTLAPDLEHLDGRLRRAAHALAVCGVVVLVLQAFSIVADALARWVFNMPIPGMEDVNTLVIAVTVSSFMPALFMERANITVNLLGRAAGPRISAWFDAFGHVLALAFIVLLAWQYLAYAIDLQVTYTVILELPKRPPALLAGALLAATALLQTLVALVALRQAAGGAATTSEEH